MEPWRELDAIDAAPKRLVFDTVPAPKEGVRMPPSKTVRLAPRKGNAEAPVPACVNASVTHRTDGVERTPSRHLGPVVAQKPEDEGPFSRPERAHNRADLLVQRGD